MKKRKFAEGGATVAGPSSGAGFPSMGSKRPTSADALRYLRATGNKAGADEILKAAVGKPAKMPEDYGSAPSRNLTPQEMRVAVAELKNKPGAKGLNPDDSPIGLRPNFTRPTNFVEEAPPQMPPQMPQAAPPMTRQTPTPTMRTPVRPTAPMQMLKAGGKAKGYASGGSVKGAGIAQRGVRKCKMV